MDFNNLVKKRRSIRKYSSAKPDWRVITRAIDAARYAPLAGNMMNIRFILVSDEDKIKKIAEAAQQDFVGDVNYIVVVASDDHRLVQSYDDNGRKFARQQSGAAIENFLLALVDLELATCWVGYFDEDEVKRVLKIPEEIVVEAIFPIGKETKIKTPEKRKMELDDVLYFDEWDNKKMIPRTRMRIRDV